MEQAVIICGDAVPVESLPPQFKDNLTGMCAVCSKQVMYRPHSPEGLHLCMKCGMEMMAEERAMGRKHPVVVTKESLEELRRWKKEE